MVFEKCVLDDFLFFPFFSGRDPISWSKTEGDGSDNFIIVLTFSGCQSDFLKSNSVKAVLTEADPPFTDYCP